MSWLEAMEFHYGGTWGAGVRGGAEWMVCGKEDCGHRTDLRAIVMKMTVGKANKERIEGGMQHRWVLS